MRDKEAQMSEPAEIIDSKELARRWCLPESWIRDQTRSRCADPIPHLRLGRYVRFQPASRELVEWLDRHRAGVSTGSGNRCSL